MMIPSRAVKLALTIAAIHTQRHPLAATPWHAAGGTWTYLDLATPQGARLTIGLKPTQRLTMHDQVALQLYDLVALAPDRAEGRRLVDELAEALRVDPPPSGPEQPLSVLALSGHAIGGPWGREPDGSLAGSGTWHALKCTSERDGHAAELYFSCSLHERRAELAAKDSRSSALFIADLAAALRDGLDAAC